MMWYLVVLIGISLTLLVLSIFACVVVHLRILWEMSVQILPLVSELSCLYCLALTVVGPAHLLRI